MSRETHYDVLGAPPTASAEELKQAYRRALRTSHPDVGGSAESFRLVQAAWTVLSDAARRAEYDRLHLSQASTPPREETLREPSSSRRTSGPPRASTRTTPTFATVHGHPGGSSRAEYLETLRQWLLSPQPPEPPAKPPRIRHEQDRFLHMWGVIFLRLTGYFTAIAIGLIILTAVRGDLPLLPADAVWPVVRVLGIAVAGVAFLCGGAVALMRLATSPARAAVRDARSRSRHRYMEAQRRFIEDAASRPDDPRAFLSAPFTTDAVRAAPAQARAHLNRALAQEAIATALKSLNADFTVWHDIRPGDQNLYASHLIVGPQGLFLVEPLSQTSRFGPERVSDLEEAIGVSGVTAVLFVDVDPAAMGTPPVQISDHPRQIWCVGTSRLVSLLSDGIAGVRTGENWEVRQLVERVARRVAFA